jgi:triosephosphate isomerase
VNTKHETERNWKMHTTSSDARQLARGIVDGWRNQEGVSVILCPPFLYLALVGDILKGGRIALGAQNKRLFLLLQVH